MPATYSKKYKRYFLEAIALALGWFFFAAEPIWGPDHTFPRGPGFYFSIPKLLAVLVVYFAWMATCRWLDRDLEKFNFPVSWNLLLPAGGLVGLYVIWLSP